MFFTEKYDIPHVNFWSRDIKNGTHALIDIEGRYNFIGILVSNKKNIKLLEKNKNFTNKIIIEHSLRDIIYLDSSKENTKLCFLYFEPKCAFYNYKLVLDNDLKSILINDKKYNFFIRKMSNEEKTRFFSFYFFDIEEEYYIYDKKYMGKANLYKYKKHLNFVNIIQDFMKPITYYDEEIYEIVNNKFLILSGTQFFNYYIYQGTCFDFFIQKVKDFNYIEINKEINNYSNNTVKLLNAGKNYYIKFEINHLIKLDDNFLEAEVTFIDKYGIKYILNNTNKIINIKGKNFTVESNKIALIYFY